ncbi:hypothetical protein ABEB36_003872 [Hypothenemus hampei]|uniref:Uncharacterized protein n=1 Tax=Hypothenemus hampei TaxID=57062 RepID=A0ABD1F1S2_HYPHA
MGACVRDPTSEEIEGKLKTTAFMNTACKERVCKHKLKKLTSRYERFLDMERESINKELYTYIIDAPLDQLVSTLLPVNRFTRALIGFGDGTLTPGVSYGKNKIPAINALFNAFHRRRDRCVVVKIDEFRTTICCSNYNGFMSMPCRQPQEAENDDRRRKRHSHRFLVCTNCRAVRERNVNAARNMIRVALGEVNFHDIPNPQRLHDHGRQPDGQR